VKEGGHYARAGAAYRVAQGNRAPVDGSKPSSRSHAMT
jgi:hypothetical protein